MAKSNSNIETTNVERLEFFIIETLTRKGKVAIPDFGHLELRTVGDRRTVFFVPAEKDGGSFMQIMSAANEKEKTGANSLYTVITIPLKAEKTVTLPLVGVFRPNKRDDGTIRITFIPSSSLRKTLSEISETGLIREKEEINEITTKTDSIIKKDDIIADSKTAKINVIEEVKEKVNEVIEVAKEVKTEVKEEVKEELSKAKEGLKVTVIEENKEKKVERTLSSRTRNIELPKREPRELVKTKISEIKSDTKFKAAELTPKSAETTQKTGLGTQNWPKTTKVSETLVPQINTETFQPPKVERPTKVSEPHVSREDIPESDRFRNLSGTVLFFVALIAIVVFVIFNFRSCKIKKVEDQQQIELTQQQQQPKGVISLPSLAEQHYGHPAFWAYIYEANADKLSSPLNIPENVSLVIPDLAVVYDVDVNDSLEIRRANILADIILNRLKTKK